MEGIHEILGHKLTSIGSLGCTARLFGKGQASLYFSFLHKLL